MLADEEMDNEEPVDVETFSCLGTPNVPTKAMVSARAIEANCPRIVYSPTVNLNLKRQLAKM